MISSLILFFWFCVAIAFRPSALKCPPCDISQCPPIGKCLSGITWDVCNCCETCSKTLGEECGGPWNAYGQCGYGLKCFKDGRECPYLFNTRRSMIRPTQENKLCEEYISNEIGRCVQYSNLVSNVFKRFGFRGKAMHDNFMESPDSPNTVNVTSFLQDVEKMIPNAENGNKRFLLSGVLRGVEY